jgi:GTP cyclohydrolase I
MTAAEADGPELFRALLLRLGEDTNREGLAETPARAWAAWRFWTSGYNQDPAAILKCFVDGAEKADELVFQGSIPLFSMCEHHLAPIYGVAHIGYIPQGKIVGLSKMARLVEVFARRLQTQERMTNQVADAMTEHLNPLGVGVVFECRHLCIESRGVQKAGSITVTSALRGALKEKPEARAEFLSLVANTHR